MVYMKYLLKKMVPTTVKKYSKAGHEKQLTYRTFSVMAVWRLHQAIQSKCFYALLMFRHTSCYLIQENIFSLKSMQTVHQISSFGQLDGQEEDVQEMMGQRGKIHTKCFFIFVF